MEVKGRLVVLESANPIDLLQSRSEIQTLAAACQLLGYETTSFTLRSGGEFRDTCRFLSTINESSSHSIPLFIHISSHGDDEGLQFGQDSVCWNDLLECVEPLFDLQHYPGDLVFSISACGAGEQAITGKIRSYYGKGKVKRPPRYLFVTNAENVPWSDAAVAWICLYHRLGKLGLSKIIAIRSTLDSIKKLTGLSLIYFRWDKAKNQYVRSHAKSSD